MKNRRASQRDMIRDALLAGRVISPIDALDNFGVYRLSAVIYDLRREGFRHHHLHQSRTATVR